MDKYENEGSDISIIARTDGLLITQSKKTFLARKWQLTDKVINILDSSIRRGFDKLWVEGHPSKEDAHYICFSRSHEKLSWAYLIGGEASPPDVSVITVNKRLREILEREDFHFDFQKGGGKHLIFSYSQEKLNTLIGMLMLSEKYDEAVRFASSLHKTQTRKGTDIPYISHLMSVSSLVLEYGGNEVQAIAGLLHDAVEDQGGDQTLKIIKEKFGNEVAEIVVDCTDAWEDPKPPWEQRKKDYLAKLPKKPHTSMLVSLCDKVHNAEAISNDKLRFGDAVYERFNKGKDGTVWYYQALSAIFSERMPGPLSDRLARAVKKF